MNIPQPTSNNQHPMRSHWNFFGCSMFDVFFNLMKSSITDIFIRRRSGTGVSPVCFCLPQPSQVCSKPIVEQAGTPVPLLQ
jgi:hypothetical protein